MVLTYHRSRLQILRWQLINQQWRKLPSLLLLTKRARARAKSLSLLTPLHLPRTYLLLLRWCRERHLYLHQPRRLPLSPPPERWPPNPRRLNRLLSPLPKRHVVEIPSPLLFLKESYLPLFFFCSKIYNAVLNRSLQQTIYNK